MIIWKERTNEERQKILINWIHSDDEKIFAILPHKCQDGTVRWLETLTRRPGVWDGEFDDIVTKKSPSRSQETVCRQVAQLYIPLRKTYVYLP